MRRRIHDLLLPLLLAGAAVLCFWRIGHRPFYAPDEGRYALIGREMLESGDWVVPTLGGLPYLDKPPLLYWSEAAGMAVFGRNEFGARFFPAAFGFLGIVLAYFLGRDMYDHRRGVIAAAALAAAALWLGVTRVLVTDMLLSVAVLGAYLGFWRAWKGLSGAWLMWISLAFAFLAKGPVGPALFALGAVPFWWLARPRPPLARFRPVLGPLVWAALALPWTVAVSTRVPGYLAFFYWHENLKGLGSKEVHHAQPWYYAVAAVTSGFLPWTLLLAQPAVRAWKDVRAKGRDADPALLLSLLWAGTTMALFTVSVSKLSTYYLPMFPALAVLLARVFDGNEEPRRVPGWVFAVLAAAAPLGAAIAAAVVTRPEIPLLFVAAMAITGAGAAVAARLFFVRRPAEAFVAVVLGLAAATFPAVEALHSVDNYRSSRALVARNADLLRSCDAILSDRAPVGIVEWALRLPVVYVGDQHDFLSARTFTPDRLPSLELGDLEEFLKTHPQTVLLSVPRKREAHLRRFPFLHVLDEDEGTILLGPVQVPSRSSGSGSQGRLDGSGLPGPGTSRR